MRRPKVPHTSYAPSTVAREPKSWEGQGQMTLGLQRLHGVVIGLFRDGDVIAKVVCICLVDYDSTRFRRQKEACKSGNTQKSMLVRLGSPATYSSFVILISSRQHPYEYTVFKVKQ